MSRPLVVVGDVLLDRDVVTRATRLVPDSAAPVLELIEERERPGGAALTALLASRYQRPVMLIAPLADDAEARRIEQLLRGHVEVIGMPWSGRTPVKTRLRAAGQTVARLDRGGGAEALGKLPEPARRALQGARAILVADYGGAAAADPSVREILAQRARTAPVVWDPHPRGSDPVTGCVLVTPNAAEATATASHVTGEGVANERSRADALVTRWGARAVAITLGSRGALLSFGDGVSSMFPVSAAAASDTCGAGDCFAAAATSALGRGALPSEAVALAVAEASRFVAAGGVSSLPELGVAPEQTGDQLGDVIARVRGTGGRVVATGGCFDLLHAGHIATLEAARSLGDCLVVCLNSDASVRRLKGGQRPLQPLRDRARVLASLRAVDAVAIFDDDTPERLLRTIQPDVWVKGGDYNAAALPEAAVLREWGGEVVIVPYLPGRSTSQLVNHARL